MDLKKISIYIVCFLCPFAVLAQSTVIVKGKVGQSHNGEKVTLVCGSFAKMTMDTTHVKNGAFQFTLVNVTPQTANLVMGAHKPADHLSIYISKGDITLTSADSLHQATATGDILTEDYSRMNAPIAKLQQQMFGYISQLSAIPMANRQTEEALAIGAQIQDAKLRVTEATYHAIDTNPGSYIALMMLENMSATVIYDVAMPHFSKLSTELQNSAEGKAFEAKILAVKNLRKGLTAADFESTTPDGKKLSLHDVTATAKYTLIDFWASWCMPCRAENPNVVNAFNLYHSKGFTVISVSLDTKAENWKAAIIKDGMPWNHVSSLMGFKEPAAVLYGIQVIPQNVLVNAQGVIVATNLRGDALAQKLKELL